MVLCYHKICDVSNDWNNIVVSRKSFIEQLLYLKREFEFIKPTDLSEDTNSSEIVLTFDDGFEDNYETVLPILHEFNIPALFFISTETLSTQEENWCNKLVWFILEGDAYPEVVNFSNPILKGTYTTGSLESRKSLYQLIRKEMLVMDKESRENVFNELFEWSKKFKLDKRFTYRMLSEEQLAIMAKDELVTIGCHTESHRCLGLLSENEQYEEINKAKSIIEHIIKKDVNFFAYPFGGLTDYSQTTVDIVKNIGFLKAYSTTYKRWNTKLSKYEIPRVCISECTLDEFKAKISDYRFKQSYYCGGT